MANIKHKVCPDGTQEWFRDGKWHRENRPALIYPNGSEIWYFNGNRHREDGPAQIYSDGLTLWFFHGKEYRFDEWCIELKKPMNEIIELKLIYG